jgi:hypothetical protein
MREIVIDTETTGLDPLSGHRVVEIGAVELVDHAPTGRTFHCYLNPKRAMPADAVAVHGEFLADKHLFADVADELLAFVGHAPLLLSPKPTPSPEPIYRCATGVERCRCTGSERKGTIRGISDD